MTRAEINVHVKMLREWADRIEVHGGDHARQLRLLADVYEQFEKADDE
jgi:hypothetical protein